MVSSFVCFQLTIRAGHGRVQCVFDLPQDCHLERSERSLTVAQCGIATRNDRRFFASLRMTYQEIHAASGAAAPLNGAAWSRFASASCRCLRPSQMLSTHHIAPIGTATHEMPTSPKPNQRING